MSTGLETRPGATTISLDDLVELAWAGRIRVPHFQRDFRWTREDVIRLFDSIVKRYPVGSLLLWRRPAVAHRVRLGALSIEAPAVDQALWVVDGQQRITSLANVLSRVSTNIGPNTATSLPTTPRYSRASTTTSGPGVGHSLEWRGSSEPDQRLAA